jgi:hypothetical protein
VSCGIPHQRLMTVSGEYAIQAPAQRAGLGEQTTIGVPQLVNPRAKVRAGTPSYNRFMERKCERIRRPDPIQKY